MDTDVLCSTVDTQTAIRNIAAALLKYTEVTRHQNGRGRCATYAADLDTIAQAARQLAEMVNNLPTPDMVKVSQAEELRAECEARISQLLGRTVNLVSHVHESERGQNLDLARAALNSDWKFKHSSGTYWLQGGGLLGNTAIFISRKRRADGSDGEKESWRWHTPTP